MNHDPRGPAGPPSGLPDTTPAPSSRRVTMRMSAVTAPAPAGSAPASRPSGADSETTGRIHRIVRWLDTNKGAFSISRLIMQTGVDLRAFGPETRDDARVVSKLWVVLDGMLLPEEREALLRAAREGG